MKTHKALRLTAALAVLGALPQARLAAQGLDPWETVDDFQAVPGQDARGAAIGFDGTGGVLFSAGSAVTSPDGTWSAIVNRSHDGGANWDEVDQFSLQPGATGSYNALVADAGDFQLYVGGGISDGTAGHWIIRRSADEGNSWVTVDNFQYASGKASACTDLAADGLGWVYAVGGASAANGASGVWVVRRSVNGGPWTTMDAQGGSQSIGAYLGARAVAIHPGGAVFVVGALNQNTSKKKGNTSTQSANWTVRRSLDQGASWTTVDNYQPNTAYPARAEAIAVDSTGIIYVAGFANQNWVVRRSTAGGAPGTWVNVAWLLHYAGANGICTVPRSDGRPDDVFVAGRALDTSSVGHWLVRKAEAGGTFSPVFNDDAWVFSDDYLRNPGKPAAAGGIAVNPAGQVYATGYARDDNGVLHWITRKLAP
jgi:hypothetical protein